MEDNKIQKFISKIKSKLLRNQKGYPSMDEYAFSTEEIADLNKQNKQKLQDLKQGLNEMGKENKQLLSSNEDKIAGIGLDDKESLLDEEQKEDDNSQIIEKVEDDLSYKNECVEESILVEVREKPLEVIEEVEDNVKEEKELDSKSAVKNSFINLSKEHQDLIMENWKNINLTDVDKDIIEGKDLLNHNYTIMYADAAAKYIYQIRKKYEIVICYLVGFNNEKKGVYDKTIFASSIEDEWKYLGSYIKILESIRSFRK